MSTEKSLSVVGKNIAVQVDLLEDLKERLPAIPKEDLIDGYVSIKDMSKKIDKITAVVRDEVLSNRFEDYSKIDEKGHRYFSGNESQLKLEKRVSKPKLDQEKAHEWFRDRGLLHRVSDVEVSLSTEDVQKLLRAASMLNTKPSILAKLFYVKSQATDIEKAALLLDEAIQSINQKGKVYINEEKVSALVSLEIVTIEEIEHLYDTSVTYALKEQK